MLRLTYRTGSGATTVGKNVLWCLKSEMRCCVVDGSKLDLKTLPGSLFQLRNHKENQDTINCVKGCALPRVLLVMLDHCKASQVNDLKDKLEQIFKGQRIKCNSTQIVLLYLVSEVGARKNQGLELTHDLQPDEQTKFQIRLTELENRNISPSSIFTFVLFTQNFDTESKYLKKVINDALLGLSAYPKVQQLLSQMAILKLFGVAVSG